MNRRHFIKSAGVASLTIGYPPSISLTAKSKFFDQRPNILFITANQQHVRMMGCAGVEVPKGLRGKSFKGLVKGSDNIQRGYVISQTNTGRMLRTEKYKYKIYLKAGKSGELLFDMENDRLEMDNMTGNARYKYILFAKRTKLKQWLSENGDELGLKYIRAL